MILEDTEFGRLYIKTHARAVRYTFRPVHDGTRGLIITVPRFYILADVQRAVEQMRPRLRLMLQKQEALTQLKQQRPQPSPEQLEEKRRNIEKLRLQAKQELPPKLMALAEEYGFKVKTVRISSARTRWGSCACHKKGLFARKEYTINLSLYCVLLPEHLQRLIMLHELTHIHHMDHSAAFHAELNEMLDGKEMEYEKELKKIHLNF